MEEHLVEQLLMSNEEHKEVALSKELIYLNDMNNGSYNGQILFDLSAWANNGRMIDYANSYLQIPFTVTSTVISAANTTAGVNTFANGCNAYSIGLKNGFYQLIDSIQVSLNGRNVVEQQNFTNVHTNFRVLTSWSGDDLKKWGPSLGVYPDDASSHTFSLAASPSGEGYANNRGELNLAVAPVDYLVNDATNAGLETRQMLTTAYNPLSSGDVPTAVAANGSKGMNVFEKSPAADNTTTRLTWYVIATIRLKDLCPFFESAGLLRGVSVRATINYNSTVSSVTVAGSDMQFVGLTQSSGNTNPILYGSLANGGNSITYNATDNSGSMNRPGAYTITCGVGTVNTLEPKSIRNCRWYAASYELTPEAEKTIITKVPMRNIKYDDFYTFKITNVSGNFNTIISNGIAGMKYVVVMPFANTTAGVYTTAAVQGINTYQSPFDTAPGTTTPLATIDNFQIQIGGKNMFQTSLEYTWEQFLFELSSINAVNAGAMTGVTSGLLSKHDFEFGYRFYVCDLSRRLKSDNKVPQSIAVLGNNTSGVAMDYLVFVAYEKEVSIDTITGMLK